MRIPFGTSQLELLLQVSYDTYVICQTITPLLYTLISTDMWEIIVWTIIIIVVVVVLAGVIFMMLVSKWIEEAEAIEERY